MRGKIVIGVHNDVVVKYIEDNKNKLSDKFIDNESRTFEELFELFKRNGEQNRGFWVGNTIFNSIEDGKLSISDFMVLRQTFNMDLKVITSDSPIKYPKLEKLLKFMSENKFEYDILLEEQIEKEG